MGAPATSLGAPMTSLGVLTTSQGAPTTSLGALTASLGAPWSTVELSEKKNIFLGNAAGAPGSHSYYLWFNDFQNSCIQFIFSSRYLWIYITTILHSISGLAAGSAWEQFEIRLKMTMKCSQRYTPRLWSSKFGDALGGHERANLEAVIERVWRYTLEAMIKRVWRCTWRPG